MFCSSRLSRFLNLWTVPDEEVSQERSYAYTFGISLRRHRPPIWQEGYRKSTGSRLRVELCGFFRLLLRNYSYS